MTPLTERQLAAAARSFPGHKLMQRLIEEVRRHREKEALAAPLPDGLVTADDSREAFEFSEHVLVVIHPDGWTEVYADRWVSVRVLELFEGEAVEDRVGEFSVWAALLRRLWARDITTGFPHYAARPNMTPLEMLECVRRERMAERELEGQTSCQSIGHQTT